MVFLEMCAIAQLPFGQYEIEVSSKCDRSHRPVVKPARGGAKKGNSETVVLIRARLPKLRHVS